MSSHIYLHNDVSNYNVLETANGEMYRYKSDDIHPIIKIDGIIYVTFINRFIGVNNNDKPIYYQLLTPMDRVTKTYFQDDERIPYVKQILFTSDDVDAEEVDVNNDYFKCQLFWIQHNDSVKNNIYTLPVIGDKLNEIYLLNDERKIYLDSNYIYYPLCYNEDDKYFSPHLLNYKLDAELLTDI